MAPRRQCLKRKKKRPLSERSEFRTLPVSGAGGACSPRSGPPSYGSPFLPHFFGEAKKRVGRRDEHPATPHGSEVCHASPVHQTLHERLALCNRRQRQRRLRGHRKLADEAMRLSCRTTRPGFGPAADLPLLLRQK